MIAQVLSHAGPAWTVDESYGEEVLRQAEELVSRGEAGAGFAHAEERKEAVWRQLVRMVVTRDDAIMPLARRYLTVADLLDIRGRMVFAELSSKF